MGIEYMAAIARDDYEVFKIIIATELPAKYEVWLQARKQRKARISRERQVTVHEVAISPNEFGDYCKGLSAPDFSVESLDQCARTKMLTLLSAMFRQVNDGHPICGTGDLIALMPATCAENTADSR